MEEKIQTLRDNPTMRWTALLLLALAMFCSYIFDSAATVYIAPEADNVMPLVKTKLGIK